MRSKQKDTSERLKNLKRRYRLLQWQSKTRQILIGIAHLLRSAGDVTFETLDALPSRKKLWRHFTTGVWGNSSEDLGIKKEYRRRLRQLQKSSYIQAGSNGIVELTKKGHLELVRDILMEVEKNQNQNQDWDNRWRLVIFDIPESRRRERDFFREQLRQFGFVELQKSVWVTPFDIENELRDFVHLAQLHLQGDLRFIVAEHMDNEKDLLRCFHLQH